MLSNNQEPHTIHKYMKSLFSPKVFVQTLYIGWLLLLPWQTHYLISASGNPFAELRLYAYDILFVLLLAAFIWWWYQSSEQLNWSLTWIALTFMALVGCSAYWADDRAVSFYYWLRIGEALIAFGITLSPLISTRIILTTVMSNGLMQSGFIFWQTVQQRVVANSWLGMAAQQPDVSGTPVVVTAMGRFLRAFGTMPHPNIVAGLLFVSLASSVLLWKMSRAKPTARALRYVLLIAVPGLTLALFLTFSRAAILAWIYFCLGSLIYNRFQHSAAHIGSLVLMLILGAIYFPLLASRITASGFVEQVSLQARSQQLSEGWKLFSHHWATGLGIGNVSVAMDNHEPIHFTPLLIATELGIITALLYYYLFGLALFRTSLGRTGQLFMLGLLVISVFDHYFWTIPTMFLLWFVLLGTQLKKLSNIR